MFIWTVVSGNTELLNYVGSNGTCIHRCLTMLLGNPISNWDVAWRVKITDLAFGPFDATDSAAHLFSRRTSLRAHQTGDISDARSTSLQRQARVKRARNRCCARSAWSSIARTKVPARCSLYIIFISKREINYVYAMLWSVKSWCYQKVTNQLQRKKKRKKITFIALRIHLYLI